MRDLLHRVGVYFGVSEERAEREVVGSREEARSPLRLIVALGVGIPLLVATKGGLDMAFDGETPTVEGVIERGWPEGLVHAVVVLLIAGAITRFIGEQED